MFNRFAVSLLLFLGLVHLPAVALADPHEVLGVVPDSAVAVVSVNDMNAVDAKARKLMTDMKMIAISPLMMFKGTVLSIVDGMDESGSMAFAVLPAASPAQMNERMSIILPTTDRAKLTQFISPQPVEGDGDFLKVTIKSAGESGAYLGAKGKYSVISPSLDTVKSIQSAGGNLRDSLSPAAGAVARRSDLFVFLRPAQLLEISSGDGDEEGLRFFAMSMGLTLEKLKSLSSVHLGARLSEEGLVIEGGRPGAAALAGDAEGPLLQGLPADRFVLALGMSGRSVRESINVRYLPLVDLTPAFVAERRDAIKSAVSALGEAVQAVAVSVSAIPEGPDGLVGVTKVVRTAGDPDEMLRRFERLLTVLKEGAVSDPRGQAALARISYARAVERTADGLAVDQLRLDLAGVAEVDPEALRRVIGRDGACVRMAALDGKFVVATIGGGLARFEQVIAVVRSGGAPLAEDPAVADAARRLHGGRSIEGYLMADRALALARAIVKAVDGKAVIPTMADQPAPIAMSVYTAGDTESFELMVPYPTIIAIKDAASDAAAGLAGQAIGGMP